MALKDPDRRLKAAELKRQQQPVRQVAIPNVEIDDSPATHLHRGRVWREFEAYANKVVEKPVMSILDEKNLKGFIQWYVDGTERRVLHPSLPTQNSIYTTWSLVVGKLKQLRAPISDQTKVAMNRFIQSKELDLPNIRKPRRIAQASDLARLRRKLWLSDHHEYKYPGSRVQLGLALNLLSASGGRVGELFESEAYRRTGETLKYKDIAICISHGKDGVELHLEMSWRFRKGQRLSVSQREHKNLGERHSEELQSFPIGQPPTLANNPVLFFVAIAMAQGVLRDISTVDDLLSYRPGPNNWVRLAYRDEAQDRPVFCRPTRPDEALSANTISAWVRELGHRSGFTVPITIHMIRRALAVSMADEDIPDTYRNQRLGHSTRVFEQSYRSNMNILDGQALYEKRQYDKTRYEPARGLAYHFAPDLPQILPPTEALPTEMREELQKMDEARWKAPPEKQQTLATAKSRLKRKFLLKIQKEHLSNKVARELKSQYECDSTDPFIEPSNRFSVTRLFATERAYLADSLFNGEANIHSDKGKTVLRALIALYARSEDPIVFLPGEDPQDGYCPVCERSIESFPLPKRAEHIHECIEEKYRSRDEPIGSTRMPRHGPSSKPRPTSFPFTRYCWLCYEWFLNEKIWYDHACQHVKNMPMYYGSVTYHHTLIKPGYCPFCASTPDMAMTRRLETRKRPIELVGHVHNHVRERYEKSPGPVDCPHPGCVPAIEGFEQMVGHLAEYHGIIEARSNGATIKRGMEEGRIEKPQRPRKKQKVSTETPLVIDPALTS